MVLLQDILKVPEELREIQQITWVRPRELAKVNYIEGVIDVLNWVVGR